AKTGISWPRPYRAIAYALPAATAATRTGTAALRTRSRPCRRRMLTSRRRATASPNVSASRGAGREAPGDGPARCGPVGREALGAHDDLLRGRDGAAVAVDEEVGLRVDRPLEDAEGDGTVLVVPRDGRRASDLAVVEPDRRTRL